MNYSLTRISLLIAPFFLGGCCYFAPCHRATYIAGTVTDAESRRPIPNADVRLYYYKTRTDSSGCFALGGPDALPFEFGVSAPGYQPIVVEAIPGSYRTTVTLVPENGAGKSNSAAREVTREQYAASSGNCH